MTMKFLNILDRKLPLRSSLFTFLALAIIAGTFATGAHAQTATVEPDGRGIVNSTDLVSSNYKAPFFNSYIVGVESNQAAFRPFFVYPLGDPPALGKVVVSARLRISTGISGHSIVGGAQTITIHAADESKLRGSSPTALFSDLGQGPVLGSQVYIEADDNGGFKEIQLNADALYFINLSLATSKDFIAFSAKNDTAEETPGVTKYVWEATGAINQSVADGQTQLILTWGELPVEAPPTITTTASPTITPNQVPVCFTVNATNTDPENIEIVVIPLAVNGRTKVIDKSASAQWTIDDNEVCITNSGGIGTEFVVVAVATGNDGQTNVEVFGIDVVKKTK